MYLLWKMIFLDLLLLPPSLAHESHIDLPALPKIKMCLQFSQFEAVMINFPEYLVQGFLLFKDANQKNWRSQSHATEGLICNRYLAPDMAMAGYNGGWREARLFFGMPCTVCKLGTRERNV